MVIYPVIIPTLCRYELFKRCVDSLSKCTLADQTELVIGLDYPLNKTHEEGNLKIKEYINTIKGFKKLTVFTTEENLGVSKNYIRIREYAFEHYDALISTEDDNEFSPCFLEFMNKALNEYKNDSHIISVSGYTAMNYYGISDNSLILTYDTSAWGFGRWRGKEILMDLEHYEKLLCSFTKSYKLFKTYPHGFMTLINMCEKRLSYGDTKMTVANILNSTYQLRPAFSMVRNLGQDGSGLHSGINPEFLVQEILAEEHFDFQENVMEIAFEEMQKINKCAFWQGLSKNRLKALLQITYYVMKYVLYRIKR